MKTRELIRYLKEEKKIIVILLVVCFVIFAIYGYAQRNAVNKDILYCSSSDFIVKDIEQIQIHSFENKSFSKAKVIILSDKALDEIKKALSEENIKISVHEIEDSIIVNESMDAISITVYSSDPIKTEIISQKCAEIALQNLNYYYDNEIILLNEPSSVYTGSLSIVEGSSGAVKYISQKDVTPITIAFTTKEIIKYGFLGILLGLFVGIFICLVKLAKKRV